jgi:CcmD family protein
MDNLWYLFTAYLIIWVALWGFTWRLGRRQSRLSKEIEFLKARLSENSDHPELRE